MDNTFRIYGETLNIWKSLDERGREVVTQFEIAYIDYDMQGNIVATGSEDFSPQSREYFTESRWVWVWKGRRNKGGYRWFDLVRSITYRKSDKKKIKEFYKNKYNALDVQFRRP